MKLKVECGEVQSRAGYRPGMMVLSLDEVTLQDFTATDVLNQMDIKDVMEWLNEQGYTIHERAAA